MYFVVVVGCSLPLRVSTREISCRRTVSVCLIYLTYLLYSSLIQDILFTSGSVNICNYIIDFDEIFRNKPNSVMK